MVTDKLREFLILLAGADEPDEVIEHHPRRYKLALAHSLVDEAGRITENGLTVVEHSVKDKAFLARYLSTNLWLPPLVLLCLALEVLFLSLWR